MKRFCLALSLLFLAGGLLSPAQGAKDSSSGSSSSSHPKATPRSTTHAKASSTPAPAAADTAVAKTSGDPVLNDNALRLVICGDSTAADFDPAQVYQGWGYFLQEHFTDAVQVINKAKKGRTARSFIDQGLWKEVLKMKPKIVLIQFGQNELGALLLTPGSDIVSAVRDYRKYLGALVDTAKKDGAEPIILSPTHNTTFDKDGKPGDQLAPFVEGAQQVADSHGVPFIDIHTGCRRLYTALGPAKTMQLRGLTEDPVHFGKVGAWTVASLVARELIAMDKQLSSAQKPAPGPLEPNPNDPNAAAVTSVTSSFR